MLTFCWIIFCIAAIFTLGAFCVLVIALSVAMIAGIIGCIRGDPASATR